MSKFTFQVGIDDAEGYQEFHVEAATEQEAVAKLKRGEGEAGRVEIEVKGLNWRDCTLIDQEG